MTKHYFSQDLQQEEIELDIDELSNDVLYRLYKYVSKHTGSGGKPLTIQPPAPSSSKSKPSSAPTSSKPKKNKPMSAVEQEKKIKELQDRLEGYEQNTSGSAKPQSLSSMAQGQGGKKHSNINFDFHSWPQRVFPCSPILFSSMLDPNVTTLMWVSLFRRRVEFER